MVNDRLVYHLDSHHIISNNQSRFRKNRSTTDQIVLLETDIRKAQAQKQTLAAIFLDLEKAFDLMWHDSVLYKLKTFGISGKIYAFIKSFLHNRKIKVRVRDELSTEKTLQNGCPQGSVISPTLFNMATLINTDERVC